MKMAISKIRFDTSELCELRIMCLEFCPWIFEKDQEFISMHLAFANVEKQIPMDRNP